MLSVSAKIATEVRILCRNFYATAKRLDHIVYIEIASHRASNFLGQKIHVFSGWKIRGGGTSYIPPVSSVMSEC